MARFFHYYYILGGAVVVLAAEAHARKRRRGRESVYYDEYDTERDDSGYGHGGYGGGGGIDVITTGCGASPIALACLGALAIAGVAFVDLNNRLNTLSTDFNLVASDNNNFCTFFNIIGTAADATTTAEAQARVNSIRDQAQGVNCETNRG